MQSKQKHPLSGSHGIWVTCLVILWLIASMSQATAADAPTSYADLANAVKHSVVNIFTTKTIEMSPMHPFMTPDSPFEEFFHRFFGDIPQAQRKTTALGSGFIIDRKGLILTNNHVVEKADEIKIKLADRKEYDAEIVGRDPKTDLALVRIKQDADFPEAAKLGDSDELRVGDMVMAVGNPFGLGHTVTVGIVSAKGRVIGAGPYDDFLQTDAAINPGNSGGPLFNMAGEVVGINTAIVARAQGIGFAIPISLGKELLPQLKTGKVIRGWLGVSIQDVTPQIAKSFDLESSEGVLIADLVENGPAQKAGLKRGDVIVRYKGQAVDNAHQLSRIVANTPPGTQVKVGIIRNGETKTVGVNIGTLPEESYAIKPAEVEPEKKWGLTVQRLTPQLAKRLGWDENETGVIISKVEPLSPAAEAGLRRGDLIKEANRREVKNLGDFNQAIQETGDQDYLLLLIKRGNRTFFTAIAS